MSAREPVTSIKELEDEKFYRVADLKSVLEEAGLNFSIFSIMNAETWKCLNYSCGKRYAEKVDKCTNIVSDKDAQGNKIPGTEHVCGNAVSEPIIDSPRTRGGGRGKGHRRYTGAEIKKIVEVFKERL